MDQFKLDHVKAVLADIYYFHTVRRERLSSEGKEIYDRYEKVLDKLFEVCPAVSSVRDDGRSTG